MYAVCKISGQIRVVDFLADLCRSCLLDKQFENLKKMDRQSNSEDNLTSALVYFYRGMKQRKQHSKEGCLRSENHDQKNVDIKVSKQILNINRAALFQNLLQTDQLKHNCLAHAIDHIWDQIQHTLTGLGAVVMI